MSNQKNAPNYRVTMVFLISFQITLIWIHVRLYRSLSYKDAWFFFCPVLHGFYPGIFLPKPILLYRISLAIEPETEKKISHQGFKYPEVDGGGSQLHKHWKTQMDISWSSILIPLCFQGKNKFLTSRKQNKKRVALPPIMGFKPWVMFVELWESDSSTFSSKLIILE